MADVSPYQRVLQRDGTQWFLYAPRWMHIVNDRMLRGEAVDPATGQTTGNQIVIPSTEIVTNAAVLWSGEQFVDAPEMFAWSEQ